MEKMNVKEFIFGQGNNEVMSDKELTKLPAAHNKRNFIMPKSVTNIVALPPPGLRLTGRLPKMKFSGCLTATAL